MVNRAGAGFSARADLLSWSADAGNGVRSSRHDQHQSDPRTAPCHFAGGFGVAEQCVLHQDARPAPGQEDGQLRRARRLSSLLRRRARPPRRRDDLFPVSRHCARKARRRRGRRDRVLRAGGRAAVLDRAAGARGRRRAQNRRSLRRAQAAFRRARRRRLRPRRGQGRRAAGLDERRDRRGPRDPRLPLGLAQAARRRRDGGAPQIHGL